MARTLIPAAPDLNGVARNASRARHLDRLRLLSDRDFAAASRDDSRRLPRATFVFWENCVMSDTTHRREDELAPRADDTTVLHVYRDPEGLWVGKLFICGTEIGFIGNCDSSQAVEETARESGLYPDRVILGERT